MTTSRSCGATRIHPAARSMPPSAVRCGARRAWPCVRVAATHAPPTRCATPGPTRPSRSWPARWRQGAPTRSACTSRPSATPWWGTRRTAARVGAFVIDRPFLHAAAARVRAPDTRRGGTGGRAAAAGSRGGTGSPRLTRPRFGRRSVVGWFRRSGARSRRHRTRRPRPSGRRRGGSCGRRVPRARTGRGSRPVPPSPRTP